MWNGKAPPTARQQSIAPALAAAGLVLALAARCFACAHGFEPVFPADDAQVLQAPTADFERCLRRFGLSPGRFADNDYPHRRIVASDPEAELQELRDALKSTPEPARQELIERYRTFRAAMQSARDKAQRADGKPADHWPADVPREIPAGLPREFALYLQGALAYDAMEGDAARAAWQQLLQLPEKERHFRSVWAAYMIGRTYVFGHVEGDPQNAIRWMRRTRELAQAGFADSQGLAGASRGWEARAQLDAGHYEAAFSLYWTTGDTSSLADAAHEAFKAGDDVLNRLAADPLSLKVMTALVVSHGGPWRPGIKPARVLAWLGAIERSGRGELAGADLLAWGAYQHGDFAAAGRWLARAAPDSLLAQWLKSKLLLREGKIDESAAILSRLVGQWPLNDEWNGHWEQPIYPADRIAGELGMLKLARGKYVEALDLLLRCCFFEEGAYVAERVLTADELKAYVDAHWPPGALPPAARKAPDGDAHYGSRGLAPEQVPAAIRYLLGRRLVRLGRWKEARPYLPLPWRSTLDAYVAALRAARDEALCDDERGEQLWQAARIARRHGMELMGTELEPDCTSSGGLFGPERNQVGALPWRLLWTDSPLLAASPDEYDRARRHHPEPDRRFHYRTIAADHAWAAAALLPDESDLKAKVLCTAGNWLAPQDPRAAQKFYRALVEECGTTKLGRLAKKQSWLPPSPP